MPEAGSGFGHIDSASGNLIPQVECYSVAAAKQIVSLFVESLLLVPGRSR
jgi:hypothetical protein